MNKMLKKALAVFLCIWMLCLTGIAAFAASEQPYESPASIKLSKTSVSMVYGGTEQLTATVLPEGADQKVTWSSSDTNIVVVDGTGKLTAAKDTAETPSGKKTVTITVQSVSTPSVKATCTVTVDNDAPTKASTTLNTILTFLKTLFTTLSGTLSALPLKEYGATLLDLFNKILELIPKTAA